MTSFPSIPPDISGATLETTRWQPLGLHRYYVVADTFIVQTTGDFTSDDMRRFLELMGELEQQHGVAYLLADVRRGFSLSAEARRIYADYARSRPIGQGGTAVVGASLAARTLISLITNATWLIQRKKSKPALEFCKSKTEAMDWIDAERERWRKRQAAR